MMKFIFIFMALFLLWVPVSHGQTSEWTGNINFFIGLKSLNEDDWAPTENQLAFGAKSDFRPRGWPINLAFDVIHSRADETMVMFDPLFGNVPFRMEANTTEFNLGVRKYWENYEMMRPFVGGGLSILNAEITGSAFGISISEDDSAIGIWLGGGLLWVVEEHINIGVEAGYTKAEVTILGIDAEGGGFRVGGLVGYHF